MLIPHTISPENAYALIKRFFTILHRVRKDAKCRSLVAKLYSCKDKL